MPGGRGRNLPNNIKVLKGTLQKCRINVKEPAPAPLEGLPEPPPWLTGEGRDHYYSTGSEMEKSGYFATVDIEVFWEYCFLFGKLRELSKEIHETDEPTLVKKVNGDMKINPILTRHDTLTNTLFRYWQQFGMTPAARGKIVSTKGTISDRNRAFENLKKRVSKKKVG